MRIREFIIAAVGTGAALCVGLGTWCSYWAEQRQDQYQLLVVGQCVYDGNRLYIDCWENKPPGIMLLNALGIAMGGGQQVGAWILPGITVLAALGVYWMAGARLMGKAISCIALGLASVVYSLRVFDTPSINPDCYSSCFELSAVSLWFLATNESSNRRRAAWGLLAGVLWFLATCVKQTGVTGPAAMVAVAAVLSALRAVSRARLARGERRPIPLDNTASAFENHAATPCDPKSGSYPESGEVHGTGRFLAASALTLVGFLAMCTVLTVWLVLADLAEPAWEAIFAFNRGMLGTGVMLNAIGSWGRIPIDLQSLQLPLWLGIVGLIGGIGCLGARETAGQGNQSREAKSVQPMPLPTMLFLFTWWVGAAVLALAGPSSTMRYWQATWPPMLWFAAAGIGHLLDIGGQLLKVHRGPALAAAATIAFLLGRPLSNAFEVGVAASYLDSQKTPTERERLAEMGRRIADLVPIGERIFVWSYDSGIYLYSGRAPASRHTHPRTAAVMDEILADLAAHPPFAFLIPDPPSAFFEKKCNRDCRGKLDRVLAEYEPAGTVGYYDILLRK